jgi:hypothetical protein
MRFQQQQSGTIDIVSQHAEVLLRGEHFSYVVHAEAHLQRVVIRRETVPLERLAQLGEPCTGAGLHVDNDARLVGRRFAIENPGDVLMDRRGDRRGEGGGTTGGRQV